MVYFWVVDAEAAVVKVEYYLKATSLLAQTTLRSLVGQVELDELLAHREKINRTLREILDRQPIRGASKSWPSTCATWCCPTT